MSFFRTFRGRLLLILLFLLVTTLGVQYYFNLVTENQNARQREMQDRAIFAGIALGLNSLTSRTYLQDLVDQQSQTLLDADVRRRIRDILVINSSFQVTDSLSDEYLPTVDDDNTAIYKNLGDLDDLPQLMEPQRLG